MKDSKFIFLLSWNAVSTLIACASLVIALILHNQLNARVVENRQTLQYVCQTNSAISDLVSVTLVATDKSLETKTLEKQKEVHHSIFYTQLVADNDLLKHNGACRRYGVSG